MSITIIIVISSSIIRHPLHDVGPLRRMDGGLHPRQAPPGNTVYVHLLADTCYASMS